MNRQKQSGQSLLLVLVLALILGATLSFLYDNAQLLAERQKAKMLADQAAYATGVRQARLMNLNAYINRAQVANQLAIAQAVSMGSWTQFAATLSGNIGTLTSWVPGVGTAFTAMGLMMTKVSDALGPYVTAYGQAVRALGFAQQALNTSSTLTILAAPTQFRNSLNTRDQQDYQFDLSLVGSSLPASMIKRYEDAERQSMLEVVNESRQRVPFLSNRGKTLFKMSLVFLRVRVEKRGGAELVGMDEWKSADTLSLHLQTKGCGFLGSRWCGDRETPLGYGSAAVSQDGQDAAIKITPAEYANVWVPVGFSDSKPSFTLKRIKTREASTEVYGDYGGSMATNPTATQRSAQQTVSWDVSNTSASTAGIGIPDYYDLRDTNASDPIFPMTLIVRKDYSRLPVSTQQPALQAKGSQARLDHFKAGDQMMALSRSEVYFQRPTELEVLSTGWQHQNASLYSPYWKLRLSDSISIVDRGAAYAQVAVAK